MHSLVEPVRAASQASSGFRVIAPVESCNEEDIIGAVIGHLLAHGILVYLATSGRQLDLRGREVQALIREAERRERRMAELPRAHHKASDDLGHSQRRVEALLRSWSWRCTAPLRTAPLRSIRRCLWGC